MGISGIASDSQQFLPWNEDATDAVLTITSRGTPSLVTTVASGAWARYSGTYAESRPSEGAFVAADIKITFSTVGYAGPPIKPGDRAGWSGLDCDAIVLRATQYRMMKYWDLMVRDLVLSYDLRSSATVSRPTVAPDASGMRSVTFAAVYTALPCALHAEPWEQDPLTDDRLMRRQRYTAYLMGTATVSSVRLRAGDVLDVDGVRYEVVGQPTVTEYDTLVSASVMRIDPAG